GFAGGGGSTCAPTGSQPGALPAIPLLGALPGDDWTNPLTPWVPAVVVALGVVAGLFVQRRLREAQGHHPDDDVPWLDVCLAVTGTAVGAGLLAGLVSWLAGGAVGPGRLEVVGADAPVVGALAAAEIGGRAPLAVLAARLDVPGRRRPQHRARGALGSGR